MNKTKLGNSDLFVSCICMGLGNAADGQHPWLLAILTAPVVGVAKLHHIEGAARAAELTLTAEETAYLEEPYLPHKLVGVMGQNTAADAGKGYVWSTSGQKI